MSQGVTKEDYIKAQKSRNRAIGLGLLAFVLLVLAISMVRTKQNMTIGNAQRAAAKEAMSAGNKP